MQELRVEIEGHRLVAKQSRPDGPALLMLHNNSGSAELFSGMLEHALLRNYRLIAVDLPGHGDSGAWSSEHYSIVAMARVLRAFVEQLALSRFSVLGHSLGGHVASAASAELSGLQSLFLVSAPPLSPARLGSIFRPDPTEGLLFRARLSEAEVDTFARMVLGPKATDAPLLARTARIIRRTDAAFRECLGASVAQGSLVDERAIVDRAPFPIAFVFGSDDPFHQLEYYRELQLSHRLSRIIPVVGSGHCPHLDAPEPFARALSEFLTQTLTERTAQVV